MATVPGVAPVFKTAATLAAPLGSATTFATLNSHRTAEAISASPTMTKFFHLDRIVQAGANERSEFCGDLAIRIGLPTEHDA